MQSIDRIPKRVLGVLLSSLSAGVVPRVGAPYIAIGRTDEIAALTDDLRRVSDGEGATRFIIGRYGSGKSFLIQLMRGHAMDRGFVTADCDLSPERRLSGVGGLATYRELLRNLSCKSSPDGGALPAIIGRWYSDIAGRLADSGVLPTDGEFPARLTSEILRDARKLESGVGGFDFALVVSEYCRAVGEGRDEVMSACLRWLRGEYGTKTEARRETGLRSVGIIDDSNWYDHIKLIASLVRQIGYAGLAVFIDEGVNLYKIPNRISREANYEKILSIYNDTMQGKAPGMMFIFGGTPQFLEDTRRGLFSYEALRSRLAGVPLAVADGETVADHMGPVIRLRRLSDAELVALLMRLCRLYGEYYASNVRITDDDMTDFVRRAAARSGADTMLTPREIIRDFLGILNLLRQNPERDYAFFASRIGKPVDAPVDAAAQTALDGIRAPSDTASDAPAGPRRISIDDIVF